MSDHKTIAYLRRYADAVGTLAEMAMVAGDAATRLRYIAFYDDDASEWIVLRQWYFDSNHLMEDELARAEQFADAVEQAHDIIRAEMRQSAD